MTVTDTTRLVFREQISTLKFQTKELLTDFEPDLDAANALTVLVRHFFWLRHASKMNAPARLRNPSFEHFANPRDWESESRGYSKTDLRNAEKEIESNLRRLCKIHDVSYEALEVSFVEARERNNGEAVAQGPASTPTSDGMPAARNN